MGSSESVPIPGGGSEGYHVLRVQDASPGEGAGLEAFFDFIVAVENQRLDKDDDTFKNFLKSHIESPLKLTVYNSKTQTVRETQITPSRNWGGQGLLGVSIRFCSFEGANENVWHVLDVQPNSPAAQAGLLSDKDYIIGAESVLHESEDLFALVQAHEGKPMKLFVYNLDSDACREVTLVPCSTWGGDGSIGCDIGYGYLHRIPISIDRSNVSVSDISSKTGNDKMSTVLPTTSTAATIGSQITGIQPIFTVNPGTAYAQTAPAQVNGPSTQANSTGAASVATFPQPSAVSSTLTNVTQASLMFPTVTNVSAPTTTYVGTRDNSSDKHSPSNPSWTNAGLPSGNQYDPSGVQMTQQQRYDPHWQQQSQQQQYQQQHGINSGQAESRTNSQVPAPTFPPPTSFFTASGAPVSTPFTSGTGVTTGVGGIPPPAPLNFPMPSLSSLGISTSSILPPPPQPLLYRTGGSGAVGPPFMPPFPPLPVSQPANVPPHA